MDERNYRIAPLAIERPRKVMPPYFSPQTPLAAAPNRLRSWWISLSRPPEAAPRAVQRVIESCGFVFLNTSMAVHRGLCLQRYIDLTLGFLTFND